MCSLVDMYCWVWGTLRRWSASELIACEVTRDCRKFEKQCPGGTRVHDETDMCSLIYVFGTGLNTATDVITYVAVFLFFMEACDLLN
jgi:hypothetical protein